MSATTPYVVRHMARLIKASLPHGTEGLEWKDEEVVEAAHDAFHDTFGYYPSECPEGDHDGAFKLIEEAAKVACQKPGPTRLAHTLVTFRKPDGSLVDDTTSYSPPGAYEAAEEDAHRYGWELVAFNLVWK